MKEFLCRSLMMLFVCLLVIASAQAPATTVAQAPKQSAEIVPGENLVIEGIPKIPAGLAEAVKKYTEVSSVFFTSWHPTSMPVWDWSTSPPRSLPPRRRECKR